jgi:hypothetical protein
MSRTETHTGKFKVITRTTEDTIEYISKNLSEYWLVELSNNGRIYINETEKYDEYCTRNIEFPYDVIEVKDQWWLIEFVKHKAFDEDEDLAEMSINEDGTYDFTCQFYNGGTYLGEVLGWMLEENGIYAGKSN